MDIGEGDTEGYVSIYRYVPDPTKNHLNGSLVINAPITHETLGLKDDL